MIGRRSLLAGAGLLTAAPAAALPIPPTGRLAFRVVRNGSTIGQHALTFSGNTARLTVRVAVELSVGLGPIAFYRYRHRARESWQDGRVITFDAETNDDGAVSTIAMQRDDAALLVESSQAGRYRAPPGAVPATHWNRSMLDGPFINTQNGEVLRPQIARPGASPLPGTVQRQAERFVLSGPIELETWYDATPQWVGLRFRGRDGSTIQYEQA
jgi:hypothetical protein